MGFLIPAVLLFLAPAALALGFEALGDAAARLCPLRAPLARRTGRVRWGPEGDLRCAIARTAFLWAPLTRRDAMDQRADGG
ncbi:MAG: hypothetical protein AAF527_07585 [Pseudomonadota bacterium]